MKEKKPRLPLDHSISFLLYRFEHIRMVHVADILRTPEYAAAIHTFMQENIGVYVDEEVFFNIIREEFHHLDSIGCATGIRRTSAKDVARDLGRSL